MVWLFSLLFVRQKVIEPITSYLYSLYCLTIRILFISVYYRVTLIQKVHTLR